MTEARTLIRVYAVTEAQTLLRFYENDGNGAPAGAPVFRAIIEKPLADVVAEAERIAEDGTMEFGLVR